VRSSASPGSPATARLNWRCHCRRAARLRRHPGDQRNGGLPVHAARGAGVGAGESRGPHGTGLVTSLPLRSCMVLSRIRERRFSRCGFLKHKAIGRFADQQIRSFGSRPPATMCAPALCPAETFRRPCSPANWPGSRRCCWPPADPRPGRRRRPLRSPALPRPARPGRCDCPDQRGPGGDLCIVRPHRRHVRGRIMAVLDIHAATVAKVGLLMAGVREAA